MTAKQPPMGILAAMPEEIDLLVQDLHEPSRRTRAGRVFHSGLLHGKPVVLVFSRWGKVAAAATTTELIIDYGVSSVVFFGIAGGLGRVYRGDVVIATSLVQHDLDASPFFAPTVVPMLGRSELPADPAIGDAIASAASRFLSADLHRQAPPALLARAEIGTPRVHPGIIASGDQVVFSEQARAGVLARAPAALCVEMEGAAAAQVCFEHGVPFGCVRTISDAADEAGDEHIKPFFEGLAGVYTRGIVRAWLGDGQ